MLKFLNVKLHNFCSYTESDLDLSEFGFCSISGKNASVTDNALSNGSGKSSIGNAVCYALSGKTITGVSSGLYNLNAQENDTGFVELTFDYEDILYKIKRQFYPSKQLMIWKDNELISGKGIKESEVILKNLFEKESDFDILSSCVFLGQGLPYAFSKLSPKMRKDLLENLTGSETILARFKDSLESRLIELNNESQQISQQIQNSTFRLEHLERELKTKESSWTPLNLDEKQKQIEEYTKQLSDLAIQKDAIQKDRDLALQSLNDLTENINKENEFFVQKRDLITKKYQTIIEPIQTSIAEYNVIGKTKTQEYLNIKAHPDICPTCGQKIQGVDHQERAAKLDSLELELKQLKKDISEKEAFIKEQQKLLSIELSELERDNSNNSLQKQYYAYNTKLNSYLKDLEKLVTTENNLNSRVADINKLISTYDDDKKMFDEYVEKLEISCQTEKDTLAKLNSDFVKIQDRLNIDKKIKSFATRDLQGVLLESTLDHLNKLLKDYSQVVFNTGELKLVLDGNSLDIVFNKKPFENLSGGEKQRVDFILQLAIRQLLLLYTDVSFNILFLDEITDYLDATACGAVMKLIEQNLSGLSSVFIITHHNDSLGLPIDNKILVYKDNLGNSSVR